MLTEITYRKSQFTMSYILNGQTLAIFVQNVTILKVMIMMNQCHILILMKKSLVISF